MSLAISQFEDEPPPSTATATTAVDHSYHDHQVDFHQTVSSSSSSSSSFVYPFSLTTSTTTNSNSNLNLNSCSSSFNLPSNHPTRRSRPSCTSLIKNPSNTGPISVDQRGGDSFDNLVDIDIDRNTTLVTNNGHQPLFTTHHKTLVIHDHVIDNDNDDDDEDIIDSINRKFSHLKLMDYDAFSNTNTQFNNTGLFLNSSSTHEQGHSNGYLDIKHLLPDHKDAVIAALDSNVLDRQFQAVTQLRRFLSLDKISKAIDLVLELNRIPTLIELLKLNNPTLQYELCWILTNICAGTHAQTLCVVQQGVVPTLLALLSQTPPPWDVPIQACWCLGNLCGDSAAVRSVVLQAGLRDVLVAAFQRSAHLFLHHPQWINFARIFCWVMANVCRGQKSVQEWTWLAPLFPIMKAFLHHTDFEIVVDTCWGLSRILQGLCGIHLNIGSSSSSSSFSSTLPLEYIEKDINSSFCDALLSVLTLKSFPDLPSDDALRLQTPALRAITNLASGEDPTLVLLVRAGVVPHLVRLAHPSMAPTCAREALLALANFAAGPPEVLGVLLEHRVPDLWCAYLLLTPRHGTDVVCLRECVWGLANYTCLHPTAVLHALSTESARALALHAAHDDRGVAEKACEALVHVAAVAGEGFWETVEDIVRDTVVTFWVRQQHPRMVAQLHQVVRVHGERAGGLAKGGGGVGNGGGGVEELMGDVQSMVIEY